MATLDTTKAKDTFGDTVNRAAYGKERIILTRRGKPVAAIVPLEDLALLDELENAADAAEVAEARAEAARGEVVRWETIQAASDRKTRVRQLRGTLAHLPTTSAAFAREKAEEADWEDRR
jgi:prevent-host-death family protein